MATFDTYYETGSLVDGDKAFHIAFWPSLRAARKACLDMRTLSVQAVVRRNGIEMAAYHHHTSGGYALKHRWL